MFEQSIEAIWNQYEKMLDKLDSRKKGIEELDKRFYEAKQEYEDARVKLVMDVDQLGASAKELKKAMDILGGYGDG